MNNMGSALSPMSGKQARFIFEEKVLGKHVAQYFYDDQTKFVFADRPYWLTEAYSSAIAITDTGILSRNLDNIDVCASILKDAARQNVGLKGVDLGGGYGIFVRGMRDRGFDFFWHDLYADNIVARGFEASSGKFDVAVAFEVLEHTINPLQFLLENKEKFGFRRLIFSATCFDPEAMPNKDWWYWAFETGQHISFFSENTLNFMASALKMRSRHVLGDIYIYEDFDLPLTRLSPLRRVLQKSSQILLRIGRRLDSRQVGSLTWTDHLRLRDSLRK